MPGVPLLMTHRRFTLVVVAYELAAGEIIVTSMLMDGTAVADNELCPKPATLCAATVKT
jgi:hypothetical protein